MIRIITLAAGGNDNLNRSQARRLFFIQLGLGLDRVFADIRRLVDRIQLGFTTELYFLDRVRRFSLEIFPFYSAAEILRSIVEQGYNEARRSLEAGIKHCPQCLPAGILVLTDKGKTPIEELSVGDKVKTRSGFRSITKTMNREHSGVLVTVKAGDNQLVCTPEHPVLTQRGWIAAGKLSASDSVFIE